MKETRRAVGENGEEIALQLALPEIATDRAILYMHGFGSSQEGDKADFFRHRALAAGLAFCSFDFRAHGQSDGSFLDLSLGRNLEDIAVAESFLGEHGFSRRVLFGSSMGGASAIWYAAQNPAAAEAGLFIAPALELASGLRAYAGEEGMERWRREGRLRFATELVECELGWHLYEDLLRHPTADLLGRYRLPSLIFQGKHDLSVDWRDVLAFVRDCEFEELELHLFADGDHRLVDRLDQLWDQALVFLRSRSLLAGC
ncbi:MAG: alpha/beta fold hydrolase [Acidobacteriota bacterium]